MLSYSEVCRKFRQHLEQDSRKRVINVRGITASVTTGTYMHAVHTRRDGWQQGEVSGAGSLLFQGSSFAIKPDVEPWPGH